MRIIFELGGEVVIVKVMGHHILFANSTTNFQQFAPIDGLVLKKDGIIKEFPDLEGWEPGLMRKEAIRRFKEKIKTLDTEPKIQEYVIKEFTNMGWTLKTIQKEGFRPVKYGK